MTSQQCARHAEQQCYQDPLTSYADAFADAENHQRNFNGTAATYSYDGDGRRVRKTDATGTTLFVYNALGQMVAEYSNTSQMNQDPDKTSYLTEDALGTPRVVTGSDGQVKARHDYLPFGEEIGYNVDGRGTPQGYAYGSGLFDNVRQKFTGKERDDETGLDYFGYRYYGSTLGRWTSVDPLIDFKRNISEPQAWNQYQYCINNPVNRTDPDGQQDSAELNMNRDIKDLMEHRITEQQFRDRQNARGVGAVVGLAIVVGAIYGPEAMTAILMYAARNPDKVEQVTLDLAEASTGSPAPGAPGTLTLSAGTRLAANEISTGVRLAEQTGSHLVQSEHIGAEFVDAAGKTYDAMGQPKAYQYFGNGSKFFESIVTHVNKSVDYVALDLKGASKSQIKAIEGFVSGLTKEQQAKIIYVK